MFKELLNKIKKAGSLCTAIVKGEMYTPYVRQAIKRYEEEQARQAEEWKKTDAALNNIVEPLARSMKQSAVSAQSLAEAMRELERQMQKTEEWIKRHDTNNWRKMHGLPMRRKVRRKK